MSWEPSQRVPKQRYLLPRTSTGVDGGREGGREEEGVRWMNGNPIYAKTLLRLYLARKYFSSWPVYCDSNCCHLFIPFPSSSFSYPPPSLQPQNSIGGIKRLGFDYVVSPSPLPPAAAAADLQVRKLMQVQAAWHLAFLPSALMNPSLMEMPETVIPYNCHITRSMVPAVIATGRATFECSTSALSSLLFPTSSSSFSPSSTPSSTPSSS